MDGNVGTIIDEEQVLSLVKQKNFFQSELPFVVEKPLLSRCL